MLAVYRDAIKEATGRAVYDWENMMDLLWAGL
jgi:hypothetical protein